MVEEKQVVSSSPAVSVSLEETPPPRRKVKWYRSTFYNALILGICNFCAPGIWGASTTTKGQKPHSISQTFADLLPFCVSELTGRWWTARSLACQCSERPHLLPNGLDLRIIGYIREIPGHTLDAGPRRGWILSLRSRLVLQQPVRKPLVRLIWRRMLWTRRWAILDG